MIEINLLPWRETLKQKKIRAHSLEILTALLISLFILIMAHYVLVQQIEKLRLSLTEIQTRLSRVNKSLDEINALYRELDYHQLPSLDLNDILKREKKISDFLNNLGDLLPPNLRLREIHWDKGIWLLDGLTTRSEEVLLFSQRLKPYLNSEDWREALKKEKNLKIIQKQGLFYFQIQLEPDL